MFVPLSHLLCPVNHVHLDTLEGSITVSMEISDGCMHFSVKDTGVGIPPSGATSSLK
jgi:signal transduction histidine kinase